MDDLFESQELKTSSDSNVKHRNKSILEKEARLDKLIESDVMNEEIYTILKTLAHIYISQNGLSTFCYGIDDVCHDVASDVWISVINGRKIKSWMYYIGKMIKLTYIYNQRDIEHEIIDIENDPVLRENIKKMCASSSISCIKDFDDMERNLMLENVSGMIREIMSHIKFREGSIEWCMIYNNLCLNLYNQLNKKEESWFRISDNLKPYVRIAIEQFKKSFRNSGFSDSISDIVEQDLELLITSDESVMKSLKG